MDRILEYNDTLFKLFEYSTTMWPERNMASFIDGTQRYTYASFKEKVMEMSVLMSRCRIYGGKVAILAENCPNWTVAFFAIAGMGRVAVPILPASSQMEVSNILDHSESEALFVSARQLRKVEEGLRKKMKLIIDIDTLEVISARKDGDGEQCQNKVVRNIAPGPEDLAVIIYTSGTSGSPKGVMLSHSNLIHSILEAWHAQKAGYRDRWLLILPMAHAYEMALGMLYPLSVGAQVYYLKGMPVPSVLLEAMRQIRPTIILTVPLIIEKVYKSVCRTVDADRRLSLMRRRTPWLLDILLGAKLRKMTGGCLKFFGIGGAKLSPEVEAFLHRIHFPYAIGYGLTETAPLLCNACVGRTRVGSIGVPAYGGGGPPGQCGPCDGRGGDSGPGPQCDAGLLQGSRPHGEGYRQGRLVPYRRPRGNGCPWPLLHPREAQQRHPRSHRREHLSRGNRISNQLIPRGGRVLGSGAGQGPRRTGPHGGGG